MNDEITAAIAQQDLNFFNNLHAKNYDFTQNASEILRQAAMYGKSHVVACVAPWSDAKVRSNEPLVLAAQCGCIDAVKTLIPYSTSVFRAILTACAFGNHHCVAELAPHAVFTSEEVGLVFNNLLSANMLDGVEQLIPVVDITDVYSRLDPDCRERFDEVRARREYKILNSELNDVGAVRKPLKM